MINVNEVRLRLMTYNIGGGRKDLKSELDSVVSVIQHASPDVLALQEAVEWLDADQHWHSMTSAVTRALGYSAANSYFGPTLSLREHFHTGRAIMVQGIFKDWLEWRHGNAILSRWGFVRLGDASEVGEPRNIPLYRPIQYEGTRDTDPRYAVLGRIRTETVSPFVIGTHLSTLRGERGGLEREIPGKWKEAQEMRLLQCRRLLELLKDHVLSRDELVFLMGDFNATASESCIADVLETEGGFVRLIPKNADTPTHPSKVREPIDHIFVYPGSRLIDYQCWIVDTPLAGKASDHRPVVADVTVS